jgi:hypothetical protein
MKLVIDAKHLCSVLKAVKEQIVEATLIVDKGVLSIEGMSEGATNLVRYERQLTDAPTTPTLRGGFRPAELHKALAKQKDDVILDIESGSLRLSFGKRELKYPWLIDSEKKLPPKGHFKPQFEAVVDLDELDDALDAAAAVGADEVKLIHNGAELVVKAESSNGATASSVIDVVEKNSTEKSKFAIDILRKASSFRGGDCRIGLGNDYPLTLSWSGDGWTLESAAAPRVENNF